MLPPLTNDVHAWVTWVEAGLVEIRAAAAHRDDEEAHAREDQLRASLLEAIAHGEVEGAAARAAAERAITSDSIEFSRWYA